MTISDATGFSEEQGEPNVFEQAATDSYPEVGFIDHVSHCEKWLKDAGLDKDWKVEVATAYTIQLDFDVPFECSSPQSFYSTLDIFRRMLAVDLPQTRTASYRKLRSKGGNQHVIIDLSWSMPQTERIAWQAAFGSDNKREALSLVYASHGQHEPVLLYSRKEEAALYIPILPIEPRT
jgi:hypothetical protein